MTTAISSLSLTAAGLAVHYLAGPLRPVLLLPGTGCEASGWHDVSLRLNQAGHGVAAIDLPGPDVDGAADDVAHLIEILDLRGPRAPVVAGHRDGGAVAFSLAARRGGVAGVAGVAGGWTRPGRGGDPRAWFPLIGVPVLLCPVAADGVAGAGERLPRPPRISRYDADPLDAPARLAEDLLRLAEHAEPGPADPHPIRSRPGQAPGYLPLLTSGP